MDCQLADILAGLEALSKGVKSISYDFEIVRIDDESFGTSNMPLPNCSST